MKPPFWAATAHPELPSREEGRFGKSRWALVRLGSPGTKQMFFFWEKLEFNHLLRGFHGISMGSTPYILQEKSNKLLEHTPCHPKRVYEGIPFIWSVGGTWGMLQRYLQFIPFRNLLPGFSDQPWSWWPEGIFHHHPNDCPGKKKHN